MYDCQQKSQPGSKDEIRRILTYIKPNCPALKNKQTNNRPPKQPPQKTAFQNKLLGEETHWRGSKEKQNKPNKPN